MRSGIVMLGAERKAIFSFPSSLRRGGAKLD